MYQVFLNKAVGKNKNQKATADIFNGEILNTPPSEVPVQSYGRRAMIYFQQMRLELLHIYMGGRNGQTLLLTYTI